MLKNVSFRSLQVQGVHLLQTSLQEQKLRRVEPLMILSEASRVLVSLCAIRTLADAGHTGEEIAGIKIYWNINTTLTAGDYRVELFADNFRIASRTFTLGK